MDSEQGEERDPRLPKEPLRKYTGKFESVRLDIEPGQHTEEELDSRFPGEYAWHLGSLYIFLNGQNATKLLPSTYLFQILSHLSAELSKLVVGRKVTVLWLSDPWQMDIEG